MLTLFRQVKAESAELANDVVTEAACDAVLGEKAAKTLAAGGGWGRGKRGVDALLVFFSTLAVVHFFLSLFSRSVVCDLSAFLFFSFIFL